MIRRRTYIILICLFLAAGGYFTWAILGRSQTPPVDMVEINRLVKHTVAEFPGGQFSRPESCPYDYGVLDTSGALLYRSGPQAPSSVQQAVMARDAIIDAADAGHIYGKVLVATGGMAALELQHRQLAWLAAGMFLVLAGLSVSYGIYLDRKLYRPFARLQSFARHIAAGNLNVPLPMDREHAFGAFTESFDLMRDQLLAARRNEAEANKSKKELVASLSHDIKTPVTSIKLVSELLLVTRAHSPAAEKLQTIYDKAEQIDRLITDMLHATLEDLGELKVSCTEKSSTVLESMVRSSDYCGKVTMNPIPGCLLLFDPLRMEQVIDNLINNAYKYAQTEITVDSELEGHCLRLTVSDFGDGVPEEELPRLIQKYYRGSNSGPSGKNGSGLGLYISHHLMERMGGSLQYYNRPDGFSVELMIPLV